MGIQTRKWPRRVREERGGEDMYHGATKVPTKVETEGESWVKVEEGS